MRAGSAFRRCTRDGLPGRTLQQTYGLPEMWWPFTQLGVSSSTLPCPARSASNASVAFRDESLSSGSDEPTPGGRG